MEDWEYEFVKKHGLPGNMQPVKKQERIKREQLKFELQKLREENKSWKSFARWITAHEGKFENLINEYNYKYDDNLNPKT